MHPVFTPIRFAPKTLWRKRHELDLSASFTAFLLRQRVAVAGSGDLARALVDLGPGVETALSTRMRDDGVANAVDLQHAYRGVATGKFP